MKFKVIREHLGDKMYKAGDVREVDEHTVTQLLKRGVLVPLPAVPDAEPVGGSDAGVVADQTNAGADENDASQGAGAGEDTSLNKQVEPAKSDADHKNKAEPAAPKNKGQ